MIHYNPRNWFWVVDGDESRAWSSWVSSYVSIYDVERTTRIANELELNDVLRPYGLVLPAPTQADYSQAVQARIDAVAQARNYADDVSLASYVASTIPAWAAEAQTFVAWRDAVWAYAYAELIKVTTGGREKPSVADLVAELPAVVWPE